MSHVDLPGRVSGGAQLFDRRRRVHTNALHRVTGTSLRKIAMLRVPLCVLLIATGAASSDAKFGFPWLTLTKQGLVRGRVAKSAAGKHYVAFKGIPYARPPVGELRFEPPQRHPGWYVPLDAGSHRSVCPQIDTEAEIPLIGEENCLFLNVYTRKVTLRSGVAGGLPVMVFIHGGSYVRGSGDDRFYGPDYLMDEDIVLVTINYRLGVFGFMTTYDAASPGNYGILDQVMALQWVQDNIASFGGDPRMVTIFGHSAGSVGVSLLVLSPLTKGLFHHAISQSGSSLANFGASGRRQGFTAELAKNVNCAAENNEAMVACLKQVPAQKLLAAARPDVHRYQPRVDSERDSPLLPKDPRILLERGNFHLVSWMQGVTKEEGWLFVPMFAEDPAFLEAIKAGNTPAWGVLADTLTTSASNIVDCGTDPVLETLKVQDFYSDKDSPGISSLLPVAKVFGDRFFNVPMWAESSLASRHTAVYRYVFEYKGPGRLFFGDISALGVSDTDPGHGDDLMYLFSQRELPLEKPGTPNHNMICNMVGLWTSFARTGRPSFLPHDTPDWPILTEQSQRHMRLDSVLSLGERLFEDRINFWKTVAINEPWRQPVVTGCLGVQSNANPLAVQGRTNVLADSNNATVSGDQSNANASLSQAQVFYASSPTKYKKYLKWVKRFLGASLV